MSSCQRMRFPVIGHLHLFCRQLPIGDTLKAILLNKINTINKVSELQGIHKAVTGSILELLTDDFVDEGERFKMRFTLREFLEVTFPCFSSFWVTISIVI